MSPGAYLYLGKMSMLRGEMKAVHLIKCSAYLGCAKAQYILGLFYDDGYGDWLEPNKEQARYWYELAAQ
jgi:TPR repeat protein